MPESTATEITALSFIIDTREKLPYTLLGSERRKLTVGDYTVQGFEHIMAIERKSYDDIYNCLSGRLPRFRKQLKALGKLPHSALLIDSTLAAFMLGHVFKKLTGRAALARLARLCFQYSVPFHFCDRHGSDLAAELLYRFWKIETGG